MASTSEDYLCSHCNYDLNDAIASFYNKNEESREFLIKHGVLPYSVNCQKCGCVCYYRKDRHSWMCSKWVRIHKKRKQCGYSVTEYKGTLLNCTQLPPWKVVYFINYFLNGTWNCKTVTECNQISRATNNDFR